MFSHHDGGEVLALKSADGVVQRLVHGGRDALRDQPVQVDGATQQLKRHNGQTESLSAHEKPFSKTGDTNTECGLGKQHCCKEFKFESPLHKTLRMMRINLVGLTRTGTLLYVCLIVCVCVCETLYLNVSLLQQCLVAV